MLSGVNGLPQGTARTAPRGIAAGKDDRTAEPACTAVHTRHKVKMNHRGISWCYMNPSKPRAGHTRKNVPNTPQMPATRKLLLTHQGAAKKRARIAAIRSTSWVSGDKGETATQMSAIRTTGERWRRGLPCRTAAQVTHTAGKGSAAAKLARGQAPDPFCALFS
jgi:hypothetical protein